MDCYWWCFESYNCWFSFLFCLLWYWGTMSFAGCLGVCWLRGKQHNPVPLGLRSLSTAIPVFCLVWRSSWPRRLRQRITRVTEHILVSLQCSLRMAPWADCYGSLSVRSSHRGTGWCEPVFVKCRFQRVVRCMLSNVFSMPQTTDDAHPLCPLAHF